MLSLRGRRLRLPKQPQSAWLSLSAGGRAHFHRGLSWRLTTLDTPSTTRTCPGSSFKPVSTSTRDEEGQTLRETPKSRDPISTGDVLDDRYKMFGRFEYGPGTSDWLCEDLANNSYVSARAYPEITGERVLQIYEHLSKFSNFDHVNIAPLDDHCIICAPNGTHDVFIHPAQNYTLSFYRDGRSALPQPVVQDALKQVLPALDFLHSEAGVIHTIGYNRGNLTCIKDIHAGSLAYCADEALSEKRRQHEHEDRENFNIAFDIQESGPLLLTDFSGARIGREQSGTTQASSRRPPEMILGMKWGPPVDMWGVGLMVWDMLESKPLFEQHNSSDQDIVDAHHLASMIALFGPPPLDFLQRGERYLKFWDENGDWRGLVPIPSERKVTSLVSGWKGDEWKDFLPFIKGCLRWHPELRMTAKKALTHPWLSKFSMLDYP